MTSPKLYSTFLLWLLAELFENLPEVGDVDKPKMAFFFEEAHLLFSDAPPALLQKIEQVVRLIRSKGVGVYFITQNPNDVPETVLAQLGNRVQHALRAFTPREQKAVRAAAETLRTNPSFDTRAAISELGVGEALVSFLDERGTPVMVERAWVLPPASRIGSITPDERRAVINGSVIRGHYEQMVDRESAYEKLKGRAERSADAAAAEPATRRRRRRTPRGRALPRLPRRRDRHRREAASPTSCWDRRARAAAGAKGLSNQRPAARRARSDPAWRGRSCVECWDRCWGGGAEQLKLVKSAWYRG